MFPIQGTQALYLAVIFGGIFGFLLQRGRVVEYDVIVNFFRFKDWTVLKVMLTAIIVGGIGIKVLSTMGLVSYHIKSADLLAVTVGATLFGVGMVLYGYCPGTGVAAIATGKLDALIGFFGMLVGGVLYAYSFSWIKVNILPVASFGKIRLSEITGVSDWVLLMLITALGLVIFYKLERNKE